jgi:hypothetical protein
LHKQANVVCENEEEHEDKFKADLIERSFFEVTAIPVEN